MLFRKRVNLNIERFFGLNMKQEQFDVGELLDLIKIGPLVENTKTVQTLVKSNGKRAMIVSICKRQEGLKILKRLLNSEMLPYDEYYYVKRVNTGSEHDRRYGAEDKLLQFAYTIAMGKPWMWLQRDNPEAILRSIRELDASKMTRFDRFWDILGQQVGDYIRKFKRGEVGVKPE